MSSQELEGEDGRGKNAFDGNPITIWHAEWFSAIDGKPSSIWHTKWCDTLPSHPHEIQIDLGTIYEMESFHYLPRQDGNPNGRIKDYVFYVSNDRNNWGSPAAKGRFSNSASEKTVLFNSPATGRFIRLVALSEVNGRNLTSMSEINVTGTVKH